MHALNIEFDGQVEKRQVMDAVLKLAANAVDVDYASIPLYQKISALMDQNKKLVFILPAFPAKSPSPEKTRGRHPDLGEVLGLLNLQKVCSEINRVYVPGAEIVICSDGRVFSDVVDVSDEVIDQYADGIDEIIKSFGLDALKTYSMDHLHPDLLPEELRTVLLAKYAQSLEEVRERVLSTMEGTMLFNGMHRFMIEDQKGRSALSKTQLHKIMKPRTLELIRRSDAWSVMLKEIFPEALRLSIHPHPITSEKFGVKLLSRAARWATPWHNVTVRVNGSFELMSLKEAQALKATRKIFGGKYVYYEV